MAQQARGMQMQQFPPNQNNAAPGSPQNHHQQQQQQQQQLFSDPFEALANNKGLKLRLDLYMQEEDVVRQRVDRKEQRLQNTKNEIYQLLGIFFVFQGVILTAIAQATNLPQKKFWIPLALSILASISTVLALWYKLGDCSDMEKQIVSEKSLAKALFDACDKLKTMAGKRGFNPGDFIYQPQVKEINKTQSKGLVKRLWDNHMRVYGAMLIVIVVFFSVIMAISCVLIHGESAN